MGQESHEQEGDHKYLLERERLHSFDDDWPNDRKWFCTPEKLAKAGFFFKPEGDNLDNVRCAFCGKELDGWEPDDDPLLEHQKHSPKCPFTMQSNVENMTLEGFVRFLSKVKEFRVENYFESLKTTMKEEAKLAEEAILSHVNKK